MVDKFRGLEGKIRIALEKETDTCKIEAFNQVLDWIKDLNNIEVFELRQMIS
jgi:hypothetical protein